MTMKILLIPGLTLPHISADDVARIRAAAGDDAEVVVTTQAEAPAHAAQAEVILGGVPHIRPAPASIAPPGISSGSYAIWSTCGVMSPSKASSTNSSGIKAPYYGDGHASEGHATGCVPSLRSAA